MELDAHPAPGRAPIGAVPTRTDQPILRRLGRAARNRSGSTVIEMALIVPAMIMLLFVVVEFGVMLTAQGLLDSAALRASRTGSTGYTPAGATRDQFIRQYIADQAYGLLKADRIVVSAKSYASFDEIDVAGKGTTGFGTSGQVVVYKLSYPWTGLTLSRLLPSHPITLNASLAVRNEPW